MKREDLLKLLKIKPETVKPITVETYRTPEPEVDVDSLTDTVLVLDKWDLAKGYHLSKELNNVVGMEAMADFFGAAFMQAPQLAGQCVDTHRQTFVETLLDSPEYHVLHQSTMANELASKMAAVQFAQQFSAMRQEQQRRAEKGTVDKGANEVSCLRAVASALQGAQEEVEELEGMCRAIGLQDGTETQLDVQRISNAFNRVKGNRMLRRILDLAGRYRLLAQAKQRQKTTHGYDDMVGVELAGDVGRLLPLELAMLADEDFELDAMRRLVEGQSMCRQYRGIEKQGKGPIVIMVDESGSMEGEPIANAKAFALAMAWVAKHQNRWCMLGSFSSAHQGRCITLAPGKWDENALMTWLCGFYDGGTSGYYPLQKIPQDWNAYGMPKGKTDMIIITDGDVHISPEVRDSFLKFKAQEKVTLRSLLIGGDGAALACVSDETYNVNSVDTNVTAVNRCLAI